MTDRTRRVTNRNGAVGDYARFAAPRRSVDDIVADAIVERRGERRRQSPAAEVVLRDGDFSLVRYHHGSEDLICAVSDLNLAYPNTEGKAAVFGVVGAGGRPLALIETIEGSGESDPRIFFVFANVGSVPGQTMLAFLRHLDIPPSWRAGADLNLAELFDSYWNKETEDWETRPPRHLVSVGFHRVCFGAKPALRETVDVFVLPSSAYDLHDPDVDAAYWAADHYRNAAWEELHRLPQSADRPGFSSWLPNQEKPQMVKVLNDVLDAAIARLEAASEEALSPPSP